MPTMPSGLRSIAIRPHVVFGAEREQGLTAGPSLACRAAVNGERYVIGSTGRAGYDYVEDVARAFVRGVLECSPGATIVDLPSEPATPEDIVETIEKKCSKSGWTDQRGWSCDPLHHSFESARHSPDSSRLAANVPGLRH